jgi:hypothetical protein
VYFLGPAVHFGVTKSLVYGGLPAGGQRSAQSAPRKMAALGIMVLRCGGGGKEAFEPPSVDGEIPALPPPSNRPRADSVGRWQALPEAIRA